MSVADTLRVAAAQAESVSGEVEVNVARAVELVASAAESDARVVVLPELFLTGYDPAVWRHDLSLTPDDEVLDPLREIARERDVVVVVGAAVRRALDESTLSVLVVDPAGAVSAAYDKQHLFSDEAQFFTPGTHGTTLGVDGWPLALGVCYDGCFPEHAADGAARGARAYLVPAAYVTGSEHRRDLYYAARALDNGIYVVLAGLAGRCGDASYSGGSAVYEPEGRALDRLGAEAPGLVVADLSAAEVRRVQQRHPMGAERLVTLGERAWVAVAG